MGIDHGATLIYGYHLKQFKTYDEISNLLTDKTNGNYPGGREVLEHLMQKHDKLTMSFNHNNQAVIGVELADIFRTGKQEIKEQDLMSMETDLKTFEAEIKQIAELENPENPKILLHSTLMG